MQYLVELFFATPAVAALSELSDRVESAVRRIRSDGVSVRYLRAIAVPEDETCFFLYEADSAEAVARTTALAGIPFERVVEAASQEARTDP